MSRLWFSRPNKRDLTRWSSVNRQQLEKAEERKPRMDTTQHELGSPCQPLGTGCENLTQSRKVAQSSFPLLSTLFLCALAFRKARISLRLYRALSNSCPLVFIRGLIYLSKI